MCAITSHLRVNSGNFPRVVATHVEAYSGVSGHIANNSGSIFRQISVISQHCRRQVIIMGGVHSRRTGPGKIDKERCKLKICCLTFQMTFDIVLTSFVIYNFSTLNILCFYFQFRFRVNPLAPSKGGYFILSLKSEKIKVVNADTSEITLLNQIIRRHTKILSEGWERHMTWAFQLGE